MEEIMLQDTPIEERKRILRDSCDQIVERSYTRKFDQTQLDSKRAEIANVLIQINELDEELATIRADFKGRIKPLQERLGVIRDEIKAGGEWVRRIATDSQNQKLATLLFTLQRATSWRSVK